MGKKNADLDTVNSRRQVNQVLRAHRDFVASLQVNCVVTLKSQRSISPITLHGKATRFLNQVQRVARGRNWAAYPSEKRPIAVGYLEDLHGSPHLHLAVRASLEIRCTLADAARIWRNLVPGGHYHYDYLENAAHYASYITKDFWNPTTREEFFVYGHKDPTSNV